MSEYESYIGNQPKTGDFFLLDSLESQFDGSKTTFFTSIRNTSTPHRLGDEAQVLINYNGDLLTPYDDYTIDGYQITFSFAPESGDSMDIISLGNVSSVSTSNVGVPLPIVGQVTYIGFMPNGNLYTPPESGYVYYVANGSSIGVIGSGAAVQDGRLLPLYRVFWNQDYSTVSGGKGLTADTDWETGKILNVPEFRNSSNEIGLIFTGAIDKSIVPYTVDNQILTPITPIGLIAGFIGNPGSNWLLCDGSTIPPSFEQLLAHLGTNVLPDYRKRFLLGAGGNIPVRDTGGVENVTLTATQMPVHSHTTTVNPHSHQYTDVEPTTNSGLGTGTGSQTGVASTTKTTQSNSVNVTVNTAGGGQAHTNMPPYGAVNYYICARNSLPTVESIDPLDIGTIRWSSNEAANTSGVYIDTSGLYWVSPRGQSIGKVTGTLRGDNYERFYKYLWGQSYTSLLSGSKAASYLTDWTANKELILPNWSNRLPRNSNNLVGSTGGSSLITLTNNELPAHSHGYIDPGHGHFLSQPVRSINNSGSNFNITGAEYASNGPGPILTTQNAGIGISIQNTGNGQPFSILPPYVDLAMLMYTGIVSGQIQKPKVVFSVSDVIEWVPPSSAFSSGWSAITSEERAVKFRYSPNTGLVSVSFSIQYSGPAITVSDISILQLPGFLVPPESSLLPANFYSASGDRSVTIEVANSARGGNIKVRPHISGAGEITVCQIYFAATYYVG